GWDQHAVHGVSGHPLRRGQAVRLRAGTRARDARALPGDEERHRRHGHSGGEPVPAVASTTRYRWAILAAGTAAQTGYSVRGIGLPVLVPTLRAEYGLSLGDVGILLAAGWVGSLATLLPWGLAADRVGERAVLTTGLGACAVCLAAAGYAQDFAVLLVL